jgi:hypothetical protein
MTRREALLALAVAFALVTAGLAWLLGGAGLIIGGILAAAATLLGFERIDEERRGEALEDAVPQPGRGFARL